MGKYWPALVLLSGFIAAAQAEESNLVSAEFSLGFDSRYMTYGVIDGKDPIVVPTASIAFFDLFYFGVEAIIFLTTTCAKPPQHITAGGARRTTGHGISLEDFRYA